MIRFVNADDVLPLRSQYLRNGADIEACRFDGDDASGAFHLGYFIDEHVVSVASFHPQSLSDFSGSGVQLRGMVTAGEWQGKGFGNKLVNFAIVYIRGQNLNYLWCNARKAAYKFYTGLGFEFISPEFEIPGIGSHRKMYLKIR